MLRRFAALDDTLIDRWFQPLADQITGRFGIGRFRAATLCIDGAAFAWLLSQAGALAATAAAGAPPQAGCRRSRCCWAWWP